MSAPEKFQWDFNVVWGNDEIDLATVDTLKMYRRFV